MARTYFPGCRHGYFALCSSRNGALLAGVGVPFHFFGGITSYHALSHEKNAILKRRLSAGPTAEKERTEKIIMLFASIGFITLLIAPALDYRFGWSTVPLYGVIVGDALVAVGFYIIPCV